MSALEPKSRARAFEWKCLLLESVSPIPALLLALGYLGLVLDLTPAEWLGLVLSIAGYALVIAPVTRSLRQREIGPILSVLGSDDPEEDGARDASRAEAAFRAIMVLPLRMQRTKLWSGFVPCLVVPLAMWAMGHSRWLDGSVLRSFFLVTFVSTFVSANIVFYWSKQRFADQRMEFARRVADPAIRSGLVERYSLVRKLQIAIVMPALAGVLLVLNVVSEGRIAAAQEQALSWSEAAVNAVADADPDLSLEERMSSRLPARGFWPIQIEMVELTPDRIGSFGQAALSSDLLDALHRALANAADSGTVEQVGVPEIAAYRRLADGRVLVGAVDRGLLAQGTGGVVFAVGLVCLAMTLFAVGFGGLIGHDLRSALAALREEADRMASGDLRQARVFESEDELGDFGRAFQAMGSEVCATVERVGAAADRVEKTSGEVATVVAGLASESTAQFERLGRANELMVSINRQVREVSQSAEALNLSIDESSSSVIELGAAGDGLNETASVLSTKIDEVSGSMEQMVETVKAIGSTTERLSAASEETSSSMEEMASAMRVVDTAAETTAKLSRDVVEKAELGQARVSQTIVGMDAIREATDAAERVIRGLGARTREIGGILDVIDDVADETNLLALNAAIIAAQAGEHGKAFSVVADEIKELADRVLASTKEIGGLIRAVQEEGENAIGAIEAGSESVMSGVDLSAEAGRTLEEITDASRESGTRISEIVSSVREQTKAASHVVALMERVRDSAEQIGAAGQEQDRGNEVIYRSALTMREVAQQVRGTTQEQARGFVRIRENVEGVREAVEQINASLREQTSACTQVGSFLEQVVDGTRSNEEAAEKMGGAIRDLLSQAEALREDVGRFRIS